MGSRDIELNEEGKRQGREIAEKIEGGFDVIYSSPLRRCMETAQIIAEKIGLKIIASDLLVERNFGTLAGKTWEEINLEMGIDGREADRIQKYDYKNFGGELADEVRARLMRFIDLVKSSNFQKPLVVCHGGIIHMLLSMSDLIEAENIPHSSIYQFDL